MKTRTDIVMPSHLRDAANLLRQIAGANDIHEYVQSLDVALIMRTVLLLESPRLLGAAVATCDDPNYKEG